MSKYVNDFGDEFEDYHDALEDMYDTISFDDYIDKFAPKVSYERLFKWCWTQNNEKFFIDFENEINEAENEFFEENYHAIEDESEDEDC